MKIDLVMCTCGGVLEKEIDFKSLETYVKSLGVDNVVKTEALCTSGDKEKVTQQLDGDRLVALACTRSISQIPVETIMEEAEMNPDNLVIINAKEQLASVHKSRKDATRKAKTMLKAAITEVKYSQPLDVVKYERCKETLVVGGGIAGLTAASELADQGYNVHLIEKKPAIGGSMSLISKTFPEEDCSLCLRGPGIIEMLTKPGITYHVNSTIEDVTRTPKGFKIKYEKHKVEMKPDPEGKGLPIEAISVNGAESPVYELVYKGGADKKSLNKVVESKCGDCTSLFPSATLGTWEEEGEKEIEVGVVILATGFDDFDPSGIPKWGYGLPNVITQHQLARILDPLGPTSGVLVKPSDVEAPKKIVMVQCVGSRDLEYQSYCSKYCCMAAIKHASVIKELRNPDVDITILYRDIRASGYGFESLYNDAIDMGVNFIHGDIHYVTQNGDELRVAYTDGLGESMNLDADLLVLSTGMKPSKGSEKVAELFNVPLNDAGFYKEIDEKMANISTKSPGIYIAGAAAGPKNIPDSISQAGAASYMASMYLSTHLEKKVNPPEVNEDNCGKCGICRSVCPYDAITIPEDEYPQFDSLLCQSCGLCVSSCPTRAINTPNYGHDLIDAQTDAVLSEKKDENTIIGYICDDCGYNLLDTAGFVKAEYSSGFIPIYVNCMSNLSLRNVLNAVKKGADGFMLVGCVKDRCHFLKGTERSRGQMNIIESFFKTTNISTPMTILESSGTMVSQFTDALSDLEEKIKEAKK